MKVILTQSQLKMWQYYESMDDYREKFKASGAAITINNFAEPVGKEYIRLSYQLFRHFHGKRLRRRGWRNLPKIC